MRKIFILALLAVVAACGQVNPDTYKEPGGTYNRDDGLFSDSSNNLHFIINGTTVGNITSAGNLSFSGTFTPTGDISAGGGAGALTFTDSASSIVLPDNDATALLIGSTGLLNLMTFDTANNTETVIITGTTAVEAFKVGTGLSTFTEDIAINGGAGAIDVSGSGDSSIVVKDNDTTALVIGATGMLNMLTFDTANGTETVVVTGTTAQEAFKVDTGTATFDESVTVTGAFTASSTTTQTGDITCQGGAGALTFSDSASSIVVPDNDSTALDIGSSGMTNLIRLDTATGTETVIITGTTSQEAFKVDTGTATFDEAITVTGQLNAGSTTVATGDVTLNGGASALTFGAASSSIVLPDDSSTGLVVGSTGLLNLLTLKTSNGTEALIVTGTTAQQAFKVDTGTSQFDEKVTIAGGVEMTGTLQVLGSADNVGWTRAAAANTACKTTCAGTGSCVFGYDAGGTTLVDCESADADSCICAGPAS